MTHLSFPFWTDANGNRVFDITQRVYTQIGLFYRISNDGIRQRKQLNGVWVNL